MQPMKLSESENRAEPAGFKLEILMLVMSKVSLEFLVFEISFGI